MKKIVLIMLLVLILPITKVFGENDKKKTTLIMTSQPESNGKETDQFDCRDNNKVYVYFTFTLEDKAQQNNHILEAFWLGPESKQKAYEEYKILGNRAWIWLEIPKKKSNILDIEMPEFIHKWKLKIRVDGKPVHVKAF